MDLMITDLVKKYGSKTVVNGVSLQVKRGCPYGILGRNGAGKTTIIKSILGLKKFDSGHITLPSGVTIGYLPEERGVYSDATVYEHLKFFGELSGTRNLSERINDWMTELEITEYRDFRLRDLSKGTAQKVQLIITLIHEPEVVILDEPFSGLDPVNTKLFMDVIKRHCMDRYFLFSSHQMNVVDEICKEVIFLNHGKCIAQGNIENLRKKYGGSILTLPRTPETERVTENYSRVCNDDNIKINISDNSYVSVMKELLATGIKLEYMNLSGISLNEMFIRLLGESHERI